MRAITERNRKGQIQNKFNNLAGLGYQMSCVAVVFGDGESEGLWGTGCA
jgi:hypothetical protein